MMLERLIKQFNEYKNKYSQKFNSIFNSSSKFTYDIFDTSKKRLESEKIKIKLKKNYFDLGLYVAKQYIKKGHSDFTLDQKFIQLNEKIRTRIQYYKNIEDKTSK